MLSWMNCLKILDLKIADVTNPLVEIVQEIIEVEAILIRINAGIERKINLFITFQKAELKLINTAFLFSTCLFSLEV